MKCVFRTHQTDACRGVGIPWSGSVVALGVDLAFIPSGQCEISPNKSIYLLFTWALCDLHWTGRNEHPRISLPSPSLTDQWPRAADASRSCARAQRKHGSSLKVLDVDALEWTNTSKITMNVIKAKHLCFARSCINIVGLNMNMYV